MCTSPNYVAFNGLDYHGNPKYAFLGHHEYSKITNMNLPFVSVPCGKCMECRVQYARAWADRCVLEARSSPYNYFVTLTFDDFHKGDNSLHIEDVQKFMKRLRKRFPGVKIKYFACGEYGSQDLRKHYHLILFNCPFNDLTFEFKRLDPFSNRDTVKYLDGLTYQFSDTIYQCWQKRGFITVAPFCYQTAAYVAQYVTKKVDGKLKDKYAELGINPEFLTMSQGIGAGEYDDDIVFSDFMIVERSGSAAHSHSPRYFDKLFRKKYNDDIYYSTIGVNRARIRAKKRDDPKDNEKDLQNIKRERKMRDKLTVRRSLKNL